MNGYTFLAIVALVIISILLIWILLDSKKALVYEIISFMFDHKLGSNNCSINSSICYSLESSFYPYILIAVLLSAGGLFLLILFVLFLDSIGLLKKLRKHKNIDVIAYVGIIIAIAGFIIPFVLNTPLVDYSASINENNEIEIVLNNFGIVTAKNVYVSINSNKEFIGFDEFIIHPVLPLLVQNHTNQGSFLMIEAIPPTGETIIKARLENNSNIDNTSWTIYVRSEQWVGYHNLIPTLGVYLATTILMLLITIKIILSIVSRSNGSNKSLFDIGWHPRG